jgi:hypothetical protein
MSDGAVEKPVKEEKTDKKAAEKEKGEAPAAASRV